MRVLMLAGMYHLSGASIVIENLATQLCKAGVDVTIAAFTFKHVPKKGPYKVSVIKIDNIFALRRFFDNFDIIHNHHAITNYLALLWRPFIYHYHGAPDVGKESLYRLTMIPSIKFTKHVLDSVIAVSESAALDLINRFNFVHQKVHVIYNGVDTSIFKPGLKEKYRRGEPQLLFVGTLYNHKRADELILAMRNFVKFYPGAFLQIVGYGPTYKSLNKLVSKLKLQDHIELVGRVPRNELPYYYASCDLYVTASRWELFGLPLLEAMAFGKPVITNWIEDKEKKIFKIEKPEEIIKTIGSL